MSRNVFLLKSWWLNAGDGFVKRGCHLLLREILPPEYNLVSVSMLGANKYSINKSFSEKGDFPSVLDLLLDDNDILILAGCILDSKIGRLTKKLKAIGKRPNIVLLGAGARSFEPNDVTATRNALKELAPDIIVSRDRKSHDHFGDLAKKSALGIDCAYFNILDNLPIDSKRDLTIRTFNRMKDPFPDPEAIYPLHSPFSLSVESSIRGLLRNARTTISRPILDKSIEYFISDDVEEYIALYRLASLVHTDMVHATVASICYGTMVQMHHKNPRVGVITEVVGDEVLQRPTVIDTSYLRHIVEDNIRVVESLLHDL